MDRLPLPVKGIVEQKVEEGILLLRETGEYVVLNHSAAIIWKHLGEVKTLQSLLEVLSEIPNSPDIHELQKQAETHINKLVHAGFLWEEV